MYGFRLWFASERAAIAKDELDAVWPEERDRVVSAYPSWQRAEVAREYDSHYSAALARITHNIHPLCMLRVRKRI